ncbi:MAG TPA: maleylpyruvate isomerase family mycothiol-dependent enzyme [Mycobacteriales bacterium]|nr:maleylpyruvate isomerase family mycothiol-dependent enzyme [Mycobacteriales bacterium]
MDDAAIFAACETHRLELADFLESLTGPQWDTASLCAGWTVRTVAGHLVASLTAPGAEFGRALVRHFGRMHAANDSLARRYARQTPESLVAALRRNSGKPLRQPVIGAVGPLADLLVHGADIRLPLGSAFAPPLPDVIAAVDFLTGRAPGFVPRRRLSGLRLKPSDVDRTWGDGLPLTGRAADLMVAACGRAAVLDTIGGAGRDVLRQRLA